MMTRSPRQERYSATAAGLLGLISCTGLAGAQPVPTAQALSGANVQKPNVLLILADDLGWSDLGCLGGEIRTPSLDALAQGGLTFTQFYNSARCSPTRA